jgi:hypothetical protein
MGDHPSTRVEFTSLGVLDPEIDPVRMDGS